MIDDDPARTGALEKTGEGVPDVATDARAGSSERYRSWRHPGGRWRRGEFIVWAIGYALGFVFIRVTIDENVGIFSPIAVFPGVILDLAIMAFGALVIAELGIVTWRFAWRGWRSR